MSQGKKNDRTWPDEPVEFDPDSLGPDPPAIEEPTVDTVSLDDVPAHVSQNFIGAVLMANISLLGLSVGLMFIYFRNNWEAGGAGVLIGIVALIFVIRYYWRFKQQSHSTER